MAARCSVLSVNRSILVRKRLSAFIGHRFSDGVKPNLRYNLAVVFKPYGIKPCYSDTDSPNGSVFQIILDRIGRSDFSIFDDRETEAHPNTLIEIGAAIGLGKPHFYFNYENKDMVRVGKRPPMRITTPSDLAGMMYMPYRD